jgi:hypothetical protein
MHSSFIGQSRERNRKRERERERERERDNSFELGSISFVPGRSNDLDVLVGLEIRNEDLHTLGDIDLGRLEVHLGVQGSFVRSRDSREFYTASRQSRSRYDEVVGGRLTLDDSLACLLVETLGIPLFYLCERCIDEDLDERDT